MNSRGQDYINHRIKEAKEYIAYGIEEGYFDENQFEDMTDEEIVFFADQADARAEANYEAYREQEAEAIYENALEAESTGN